MTVIHCSDFQDKKARADYGPPLPFQYPYSFITNKGGPPLREGRPAVRPDKTIL
jgi:hypothetical protein